MSPLPSPAYFWSQNPLNKGWYFKVRLNGGRQQFLPTSLGPGASPAFPPRAESELRPMVGRGSRGRSGFWGRRTPVSAPCSALVWGHLLALPCCLSSLGRCNSCLGLSRLPHGQSFPLGQAPVRDPLCAAMAPWARAGTTVRPLLLEFSAPEGLLCPVSLRLWSLSTPGRAQGGSGMSAGGGPRPLEVAVPGERGSPSQRLKRRRRGRVSLCLGGPFTWGLVSSLDFEPTPHASFLQSPCNLEGTSARASLPGARPEAPPGLDRRGCYDAGHGLSPLKTTAQLAELSGCKDPFGGTKRCLLPGTAPLWSSVTNTRPSQVQAHLWEMNWWPCARNGPREKPHFLNRKFKFIFYTIFKGNAPFTVIAKYWLYLPCCTMYPCSLFST